MYNNCAKLVDDNHVDNICFNFLFFQLRYKCTLLMWCHKMIENSNSADANHTDLGAGTYSQVRFNK